MTFAEQKAEVTRRLSEQSVNPAFWTQADIATALNEGYMEMSDESEWYERALNLPLLSKRTYYDLRAICAHPFLAPRRCFNVTTNHWLTPLHERELDLHTYRRWEQIDQQPERMFMRGLWWFGTFPRSSSDSGFLKLYFTSLPAEMSADSDTPGFPQELHYGIVEYALFDLLAQEAETAKAAAHFAEFQKIAAALKAFRQNRLRPDRINALRG